MVHEVASKADLEKILKDSGNKLVVIDFFATWCGPCKFIAPKIEELAQQETNVVFLKVDVDVCEDVTGEYEVSSMPTFVFIKNCQRVSCFSGANFDKLKEEVMKYKSCD